MKYCLFIAYLFLAAAFTGCDMPSSRSAAGKPASTFKGEVARLTSQASNRTDRIQALYSYVRDNVRQTPTSYG
jgi:hypothetical protein